MQTTANSVSKQTTSGIDSVVVVKQTKNKNGKRPDNHIREQEGRRPLMKEADKAIKADNQKLRKMKGRRCDQSTQN